MIKNGNLNPKTDINNAEVRIRKYALRATIGNERKCVSDAELWSIADKNAAQAVVECFAHLPEVDCYAADLHFEWKHRLYEVAKETAESFGVKVCGDVD